jgi:hypothetical protein
MNATRCPAWTPNSTSAQDTNPDWEEDAEARERGGEASAPASNGWRVYVAPKGSSEGPAQGGWSVHQRAVFGLGVGFDWGLECVNARNRGQSATAAGLGALTRHCANRQAL